MRHTYEPLETMNIPVGEHSLYISIVIAILAPLNRDEGAFGDAFDELFPGRKMGTKRRDLRQAFVAMTGDEIPTILCELVRDYLIPAFTQYCDEHGLGLKASANETENEACIVENMAAMLAVTITCHTPNRVASAGVMCEAYPKPGQDLHILKQENAWLPLLTRDVLARIKNNASNTEDEINPIGTDACPAFEGMVHSGIKVILNSSNGLKIASLNDRMLLTSRTVLYSDQSNCALEVRYNNLVAMTKAVKSDLTRVNLDTLQTHPEPWEGAELTGAGRGALVGVILAGALELGFALEVSAAAASTALIGTVPLAVLLTILGVGVGVVGKKASKEYCQALVKATDYLNDQRYFEAAKVLDAEFATSTLTQWARSGFLSHEHQALAHMYRAICEEGIEASPPPNLENPASRAVAYQHYTQAADYAKKANREFLHFISHLCRLKLLKKSTSEQLGFKATPECAVGVVHQQELDKTLQELTEQYRHGFQDLYYKLNTSMINLLEAFSPGRRIGTQHVSAANTFLKFNDFYLLQYVNEGRGAFVDLLGLCVQGVLLAKLHQTHLADGLEPETKNQFILKLGNSNPRNEILNLALACEKISEAAKLLSALKTQYAEQIAKDERLKNGLLCIADFMVYFHAHCHDNGSFFKEAYKNIVETLAVPEARAKQILAYVQYTIELLNRIKTHKRVLSIPDWFSALEQDQAGFNNKIDPDTGDTMLHFLTRMPFTDDADVRMRIKSIAKQLKNQVYVRNHAHETPLFALKANDPYGIAAEIFPESNPSDSLKVFDNPATTHVPSFEGRKKLLQHQFREKRISEQNIHNIANSMDGFSSVELEETVAPIDASIIDINDEYATKMVDYCKIKKKPFSYILDLIKKAIWNDCDRYISSKVTVARSLDSYMSGKKSSYKENVRKSLEIVFNDPVFQGLIREYYDRIQESTIPKSREKTEYLTSLVAIQDEDPASRLLAVKEFCKKVKDEAIQNSQSKFAELIASYIDSAWPCVSLQPKITNSNVVFFRPIREGTAEASEKPKFDIIDTGLTKNSFP